MISTGIEYLDKLTSGFKLGDNVIWQSSDGVPLEHFTRCFCEKNPGFMDNIIYINFNYSPHTICRKYGFIFKNKNSILIDAFTHGKGNSDPVFLEFYTDNNEYQTDNFICIKNPKDIRSFYDTLNEVEIKKKDGSFYIFDSLTGMNELWKDETVVLDFFAFSCPKLYDLNTLAYWFMETNAHTKKFIAGITHITQVIFSLQSAHSDYFELRIDKLEDRTSVYNDGQNYFKIINQEIQFHNKRFEDVLRIGEKVKELRKNSMLTQVELASHLGMTPGAISQIENGITAPSLQTLIQLTDIFNKPIEFFIGKDNHNPNSSRYIISNKHLKISSSNRNVEIHKLIEIDDNAIVPYSVLIQGGETVERPLLLHKGKEFITVTGGELYITIDGEVKYLKKGDSILIKNTFIDKIENRKNTDAEFIYLLF